MNQKYFYISIFLIFAMFLSGCDSIIVGNPEIDVELETKRVKDALLDFWSFIDSQDRCASAWACAPDNALGNPARDEFVEPYFDSIDLLKQICPNVVIDVYAYIRDISFVWDEEGDPRAIVDIQVNRIVMGCGDLNSTKAEFGTMELTYCYVGYYDEGWYIDKVDIDLVDTDF